MMLLISLLFILVVMIIVVFFLDIYRNMPNIDPKIVVFDMDETLGHFEQLSIFWAALKHY